MKNGSGTAFRGTITTAPKNVLPLHQSWGFIPGDWVMLTVFPDKREDIPLLVATLRVKLLKPRQITVVDIPLSWRPYLTRRDHEYAVTRQQTALEIQNERDGIVTDPRRPCQDGDPPISRRCRDLL